MNRVVAIVAATLMAGSSAAAVAQTSQHNQAQSHQQPQQQMTPATSTTQTGSDHQMKPNMNTSAMSDSQVKNVQSALDKRGEHLKVDGRWGPQTANAVRDFQKQNGLPQTGDLDHATMQKLDIGKSG
jgi:peptidoglycan hydrolase-like protein with peptidoglycan-binding domain